MPESFFTPTSGGYAASEYTRGPWSHEHQHAGPPAALLARAIEAELPASPAMRVARFTVEILRPVPIAELAIATEVVHPGRRLRVLDAVLADGSGKPLLRARALALRVEPMTLPAAPDPQAPPPGPEAAKPFEFPFFAESVGYHSAMETRIARGVWGQGPVAAWMRMRVPLVAGETPSPLQRVVTAADSGNGVSVVLDPARYTFINPDLSVYLNRDPVGEWVCLDALTLPQPTGNGLADTRLYDEAGAIGRSLQSLLIQPR